MIDIVLKMWKLQSPDGNGHFPMFLTGLHAETFVHELSLRYNLSVRSHVHFNQYKKAKIYVNSWIEMEKSGVNLRHLK